MPKKVLAAWTVRATIGAILAGNEGPRVVRRQKTQPVRGDHKCGEDLPLRPLRGSGMKFEPDPGGDGPAVWNGALAPV
jgi:hypothetical protein